MIMFAEALASKALASLVVMQFVPATSSKLVLPALPHYFRLLKLVGIPLSSTYIKKAPTFIGAL